MAGLGTGERPQHPVVPGIRRTRPSRTKDTYLAAQYHRLVARRGNKKALVAVAHCLLLIAYHLLARECAYVELGHTYFDQRDRQTLERRLVRRLEALGYRVTVEPAA